MKTNGIDFSTSYPVSNAYETKKQSQELENFESVLKKASEEKDDKALKKACQEFESYFINQLFKEMRRTIQPGGLIEKSQAEEIFQEMLDEEYAKNASQSNGIGLANVLYKQLKSHL
ncbi:rod-binding protein [Defluviitalea raffinosedens]|jgi:flagellar protein FlgJ|uniref:Flagellar biosynthesis protein FlgJ n=1 Tax=Defluviitalea raffinosedens TaxID=1450156 RepID=A0A7C8HFC7_9FIRM|nr:rod-binding protein [Defluviitalea raffinosedens]KAE9635613.1 flagellar biosynthesis protein FlgJ [Defluviitalea raffinosedens]MBM7684532.1 flagellar protein FlgJ [Defluviitalea raffinosedens]MBZ4667028.1 Flagellar biosynthesis protein FlgJ [Defluviitaleaceae bacterium]HHW68365.1 flagellar biosynthesis protein FlgJ [Candidatus Epulonipiscium sp.]